ncbi:DegT/DnrJ/EryC1/StrS aminotransferase [Granulicella tundricola MP5ACTX9]|uniref:DegT/DnrJ/EryC1/StrS aminotransferase n=2 Tax=Granulicella TaxID=940557 RepID=E8X3M0_GRATM|nr:DegT/DnrJ/EryC1/StrS aminotransferase [Granulicella tundricola MP5ACTX9]
MLDFSRQFAAIREEVMAAIEQVCVSQRFILGPEVTTFEQSAAAACHVPHAIGCASGTDALWLALAAAQIDQPTQSVITTPFSFFASASSILRAGARALFADIDPLTYNLSPASVAEVLATCPAGEVKAILPVHLYGQCADWDAFTTIQNQHPGLLLIEDAAQAFGAAWQSAPAGTGSDGTLTPAGALGDAAAFSFYPTKNLAAFGDAGLMTTRSPQLEERARMLRAHGMRRRYFHDEVGWNSRLDTLQAAVLEVKLRYLPQGNQRRRDLAANYNQLFLAAGIATMPTPTNPTTIADGVVLPYTHPRAQHVFHQYVIRAPRRDALRTHLTAQGIGTEVYYPLPLHLQEALKPLGYKPGDFPESECAAAEVLALPIYPELREDEQQTVVEAIHTFYA